MKPSNPFFLVLILALFFNACAEKDPSALTDKAISNVVSGITYESGNWEHPNYTNPFETHGNHRFVVTTSETADVIQVRLPWRRHDDSPEQKDVIVVDAETQEVINNRIVLSSTNEEGHILFQPQESNTYHIYYFPHKSTGGYYPKVQYIPASNSAEADWVLKVKGLSMEQIPEARVVSAQSIDDFHSFFPMEVIATKEEKDTYLSSSPQDYYLFPEYRDYPIAMRDYLPKHWVDRGSKSSIYDEANRGEYFTFQIGVFSPTQDLTNLKVDFTALTGDKGNSIPKTALTSFNTSGIDLDGDPFSKSLSVEKGQVQALWFGVDVPEDIKPGRYKGHFVIRPEGLAPDSIALVLNVKRDIVENHGDDAPENLTRLRWLNSTIGADDGFIVDPFQPVEVDDKTLSILGRSIEIGASGLPKTMMSYFAQELTQLNDTAEPIIAAPIEFKVLTGNRQEQWISDPFSIEQPSKGAASWLAKSQSTNFHLNVTGTLEYDGMLDYKIDLIAKKDMNISDAHLNITMPTDAAEYILGLGRKGGKRPSRVDWNWDVEFHHEGVWLGGINKGLQYVLRDNNYERPLNTNFYHNKPLNLPTSWGNEGKGGIRIRSSGGTVRTQNFSGSRTVSTGDTLHYNIRFLITPFKLIDTKSHFSTRFVHKYVPVDTAAAKGGTVINVHHANEINPYINYPFYALDEQKAYIDEAHSKGIKVKLYNTIRELTYKSHELFALRSLGDEILNDGEGGGHGWLQEHLKSNYHSAWHATRVNDAAILNKGTSRWTNYYIEGLNWLAKNQEIDGLYLDDIAFSRSTVKRIASVMNAHREDVVIDLHSANQFNERDGFINSAFLYMEHIPYISRLWFGEYFDYNADPDYWMTEVSGLPFGITGEMLEKGGHPYRGMVYGMTTRVYGRYDPSALWHLFDDFGIAESQMKGYWVDDNPIKTDHRNIRTTSYLKEDKVLIAIGSWSDKDEYVRLNIDWNKLGIEKNEAQLISPSIDGLQSAYSYDPDQPVKVDKGQGLILVLEKSK